MDLTPLGDRGAEGLPLPARIRASDWPELSYQLGLTDGLPTFPPSRTVVDARYLFRDWHKDGGDNQMTNECVGFGARSFVLGASGNRVEVTEMSGPRRN